MTIYSQFVHAIGLFGLLGAAFASGGMFANGRSDGALLMGTAALLVAISFWKQMRLIPLRSRASRS